MSVYCFEHCVEHCFEITQLLMSTVYPNDWRNVYCVAGFELFSRFVYCVEKLSVLRGVDGL